MNILYNVHYTGYYVVLENSRSKRLLEERFRADYEPCCGAIQVWQLRLKVGGGGGEA